MVQTCSAIFLNFSEARVRYLKTEHSLKITEWIIENAPEQFEEIAALIRTKIGRQS